MEISTIEMRDATAGRAPPYREGKHIPSYFYNSPGKHVYLPVHLLTVKSIVSFCAMSYVNVKTKPERKVCYTLETGLMLDIAKIHLHLLKFSSAPYLKIHVLTHSKYVDACMFLSSIRF